MSVDALLTWFGSIHIKADMYRLRVIMNHKIISISEELYLELEKRKRPGESLSDVIARLLGGQQRPSKYAGCWADLTVDEERRLGEAKAELRSFWNRMEKMVISPSQLTGPRG